MLKIQLQTSLTSGILNQAQAKNPTEKEIQYIIKRYRPKTQKKSLKNLTSYFVLFLTR